MKLSVPKTAQEYLLTLAATAKHDLAIFDQIKKREESLVAEVASLSDQIAILAPKEQARDLDALTQLRPLREKIALAQGDLAQLEAENTKQVANQSKRLKGYFSSSLQHAFQEILDAEERHAVEVLAKFCSNEFSCVRMFRHSEFYGAISGRARNYQLPTGGTVSEVVAGLRACIKIATEAADGDPAYLGFKSHTVG